MRRQNDIEPLTGDVVTVNVDGVEITCAAGETVLTALLAHGQLAIARNDHGHLTSAYCGMGVCYCCVVKIDDVDKRRACQLIVRDGMRVITQHNNHHLAIGGDK